ncbi:MAG: hypothetical protein H6722_10470 [Sandaracinus sp.]|nr:hypothetical protein [Sandaracinus sp.]
MRDNGLRTEEEDCPTTDSTRPHRATCGADFGKQARTRSGSDVRRLDAGGSSCRDLDSSRRVVSATSTRNDPRWPSLRRARSIAPRPRIPTGALRDATPAGSNGRREKRGRLLGQRGRRDLHGQAMAVLETAPLDAEGVAVLRHVADKLALRTS